jgi:hypothetical protein
MSRSCSARQPAKTTHVVTSSAAIGDASTCRYHDRCARHGERATRSGCAAPRLVLDGSGTSPRLLQRPRRAPAGQAVVELSIKDVRLELVPQSETPATPLAALTFEMCNDGASSLTDILVDIFIVRKPHVPHLDTPPTVPAGPYRIRGKIVLRPGYTMHYEMRLRNLPQDCDCVPTVEVVSVRSVYRINN